MQPTMNAPEHMQNNLDQSQPKWFERIPWDGVRAVAFAFLSTRLLLVVILYLSMSELPIRSGEGLWRAVPENIVMDGLIRWDSGWYLALVRGGYNGFPDPSATVFFPMYPALIWLATKLTGQIYLSGLLVSNLAFLAALGFLYAFAKIEYGEETAGRAVLYLAASPPAFFASTIYTESTFLLFILAALYFARKQNWLLAGVSGMLAAATRNTGIVIAVVIALEGYWQNGGRFLARPFHWSDQWSLLKNSLVTWLKSWPALLAATASSLGLLAYMIYLKITFNDPLAFIHQQSNWKRDLSINFIHQLYRDARWRFNFQEDFWTGRMMDVNAVQDLAATTVFAILVLAVILKLRPSLAVYSLATFAIPLLTGRFYSMRRFVLMLIPCFLLLAIWGKRPWVDRLILIVFLPLQAYLAILFSHWYFAG
jgi:hypothetical protein